MAFHNVTYDDRDISLKYQGAWTLDGAYNATSVNETGTLSSSTNPEAHVTFTFPVPAIALYYYGVKRSSGGLYGICIDCDLDKLQFTDVDAFNSTDDGHNPPVILFSRRFDKPGVHEILLKNQHDQRGVGNSQITVDRFELEVPSTSSGSTPEGTTTTVTRDAITGIGMSSAGLPTTSSTSYSPQSMGLSKQRSDSVAIISGVLGSICGLCVLAIFFILRRRRQRLRNTRERSPISQSELSTRTFDAALPVRMAGRNNAHNGRDAEHSHILRLIHDGNSAETTTIAEFAGSSPTITVSTGMGYTVERKGNSLST